MYMAQEAILARLAFEEIMTNLKTHIRPLEERLPEKRLGRVIVPQVNFVKPYVKVIECARIVHKAPPSVPDSSNLP